MLDWQIPPTWGLRKLGFLAPEESLLVVPKTQPERTFNYWGLDAISQGQFDEPQSNLVSGSSIASTCISFSNQHILYAKLRPYLNKVIVPTVDGIGTTEWIVLKPKPEFVDRYYLAYALRTQHFVDHITTSSAGARMPRARKEILFDSEIPIPYPDDPTRSLETQGRIVARLEALLAEVASARGLSRDIDNDINRIRKAALQDIFGKPEIKGWSPNTLGNLVDNHDAKRVPVRKSDRKNQAQKQYPYYGASGIIDQVEEYLFDGEYLLVSEDGANLVARTYPIAFIATGKFWVNNHAHILKAKEEIATNKFLAYAIEASDISEFVTGMAQPKLNQTRMNEIPIWLPKTLQEQEKIVVHLEAIENEVEELKQNQNDTTTLLGNLEQALLMQAFRGEL